MSDIQTPPDGTEEEKDTPEIIPAPAAPTPAAPVIEEPDYKKKFTESAREAQILASQLEAERARNQSLTPKDPTEEELRGIYPDWDLMSATEKTFAKRTLATEQISKQALRENAEMRAAQAWEKDLKKATKTYPDLKGREDEFEAFVFKPTHKGVSIEVLAKAFLHDATKTVDTPAPAPAPSPAPTPMERGGTGRQDPVKPTKLTAEELGALRKSDYKAYKEYIDKNPEAVDFE
jgi:hypothetical protein